MREYKSRAGCILFIMAMRKRLEYGFNQSKDYGAFDMDWKDQKRFGCIAFEKGFACE